MTATDLSRPYRDDIVEAPKLAAEPQHLQSPRELETAEADEQRRHGDGQRDKRCRLQKVLAHRDTAFSEQPSLVVSTRRPCGLRQICNTNGQVNKNPATASRR